MKQQNYTPPVIDVILLDNSDIITSSNTRDPLHLGEPDIIYGETK